MLVEVRNLGLPLVGVLGHRPELEDPEGLVAAAHAYLTEEHRPPRIELDQDGDHREHGREHDEREKREDDVRRSLQEPRRAREPQRRKADQRQPLDRVDAHARADELEEARHDVDLDVEVFELADDVEHLLVRFVREGDDHALDVEQAHDRGQALGAAEQREMLEVVAAVLGIGVDEADEVDPVLRMVQELPGDQLPDLAGADDHGVLQIRDVAPRYGARRSASEGDESDRRRPEQHQLRRRRMGEPGEVRADGEDPRADRDHVEDAREVVRGRVVGPLLVALVEAVQLRDDDPAGHGGEEGEDLGARIEHADPGASGRQPLCQQKREHKPGHVRGQQHPPDEPAATPDNRSTPAAVEDLERPLVDYRRSFFVDLEPLQQRRTFCCVQFNVSLRPKSVPATTFRMASGVGPSPLPTRCQVPFRNTRSARSRTEM